MTQDAPPSPPAPARRAPRPAPLAIGTGALVIVVLAGLYVGRNLIAREVLLGWLRDHGVPAQAEIDRLGLGGLRARIVVGRPDRPDLTLSASDIGYALTGPWAGEPLGLEVRSLRLVKPVLRGRLHGGKFSFGALDPVIAELRKRPPRPGAAQPSILIKAGRLLLDTDYGAAEVRADGLVANGKLMALDARLGPSALRAGELSAAVRRGVLKLRTRGDRVDLDLDLVLDRFAAPGASGEAAHARLTGRLPYPDLKRRAGDGVVSLRLAAEAARATAGAASLETARLSGGFDGRAAGWIDTMSLAGAGRADLAAAGLEAAALHGRGLRLKLDARTLTWTRAHGGRLDSDLGLDLAADSLTQANLRLQAVSARMAGPFRLGGEGPRLALRGALGARGDVAGTPAPAAEDVAEVVAVKRLLRAFDVQAPGVAATFDTVGLTLALPSPLVLRDRFGGAAAVTAVAGRPLYRQGRGDLSLIVAGGGLPRATAVVEDYRFAPSGLIAPLRLSVATDFAPARDATVEAVGELRVSDGATRFVTERCAAIEAQRLEFGDNDVTALKGELCPLAQPLFEYRDGAWRIRGRARAVTARLQLLQTLASEATGTVEFGQSRGALYASADIEGARLEDLAAPVRFRPLRAHGPAILRDGIWQAAVAVTDPQGRALGDAQLTHDVRSGVGEVNIDTGALAFAEGGLQPAALSPLAAALAPPVSGSVGFTGEIGWSKDGVTSRGQVSIPRLDFTSPAGVVRGLSGEITFTSLMPPAAPLEQRLRIDAVETAAPLRDVKATLGVTPTALQIRDVEAETGGGQVRIAALDYPFAPGAPWGGVLQVDGVQVEQMVKNSPFGDRMELTARVSGRLPFQMVPQGLRIAKGELHAVENGRLSIRRAALTGMNASQPAAGSPQAAPNAFSDFAYQAMENLAFQTLSAEINSLPEGRLGVLFHIKGEHQPPKRQVLQVGVMDLLNRKFLEKTQPLPSGTKVDLTLDTSLNLDQLLEDFAGYRDARGSAGVQGDGAKRPARSLENTK